MKITEIVLDVWIILSGAGFLFLRYKIHRLELNQIKLKMLLKIDELSKKHSL